MIYPEFVQCPATNEKCFLAVCRDRPRFPSCKQLAKSMSDPVINLSRVEEPNQEEITIELNKLLGELAPEVDRLKYGGRGLFVKVVEDILLENGFQRKPKSDQ